MNVRYSWVGPLVMVIILFSPAANAAISVTENIAPNRKNVGVGLLVGEPVSANAKLWFRSDQAVELGMGYSFDGFFSVYGDYLLSFPNAFRATRGFKDRIVPFAGLGAVAFYPVTDTKAESSLLAAFSSRDVSAGMGLRAPVGVEYFPRGGVLSVFAQVVPGLGFLPRAFRMIAGGAGLRAYF